MAGRPGNLMTPACSAEAAVTAQGLAPSQSSLFTRKLPVSAALALRLSCHEGLLSLGISIVSDGLGNTTKAHCRNLPSSSETRNLYTRSAVLAQFYGVVEKEMAPLFKWTGTGCWIL